MDEVAVYAEYVDGKGTPEDNSDDEIYYGEYEVNGLDGYSEANITDLHNGNHQSKWTKA